MMRRSRTCHHFGTIAFTLIEVLISIVLLLVVIVTVSQIFTISSDASARAAANAEVIAASGALREALTDQIPKMAPYLFVIDSPPPTTARREIPTGPRFARIRHDRLVFMTQGEVDEYQSFTDPVRGDPDTPDRRITSSSQALVYFGPGIPFSKRIVPVQPQSLESSVTLSASEWVFLHRSILLVLDLPSNVSADWQPPTLDQLTTAGDMFNNPVDSTAAVLYGDFRNGSMDVIYSLPTSIYAANAQTISNFILEKSLTDNPATPSYGAIWQPSVAPRTATLEDRNDFDFYTRSGSNFIPRLADFRIEWTDGRRIDPLGGDERTRWFGLRPDPNFNVNNSFLDNLDAGGTQIPNIAVRRQDVVDYGNGSYADSTQAEIDAFRDKIEWSNVVGPDADTHYRAIWRADTWQYRPKALRFTYRIYDAGDRLKHTAEIDLDEDGDMDPDGPDDPRIVTRFGRQFSIVVPVP